MKKIEEILYQTARDMLNLSSKLSISTIFLFCENKDDKLFAKLLYDNNHEQFIKDLNKKYAAYDVDFTVRFDDKNVKEGFLKTLEEVRRIYDKNGYYKALFDNDPYALAIYDLVNCDCAKMLNSEINK
jgi:hypothetical protein